MSDTPRELIAFRVGDQQFCVDIMAVREIRGWAAATPLPHAPSFVRGVINLRGAVLPIIDMAARLGIAAAATERQVIIVVAIEQQLIGLLVDAVSDIIAITEDAMQPTPDVSCETTRAFVKALVTIDEAMLGLISLEQILPAAEAHAA